MPAAPLVGAVTTRPPAAFSSFTASAQAFTHSIGSTGPRGARLEFALQCAARGAGPSARPAARPPRAKPRSTQACMTLQMRASLASISTSVRIARSFTRISPSIESPARFALRQQLLAVRERQRQFDGCGRARRIVGFAFALHGAAADRIHLLGQQRRAGGIARGEAHAVRMAGQHLVAVEQQVHWLIEGDLVAAERGGAARSRGSVSALAPSLRDRSRTGRSPSRPSSIARSVQCPRPVSASEP